MDFEFKVLDGSWDKSDQPTKAELILMKLYELESLIFINKLSEPSKLKHPNEHAQWLNQQGALEETYRIFLINLENNDIVLDEIIEDIVSFNSEL
tara:strand:- start:261 stop:545 length:285 start_codon:yes stop_codon:yes gene_type:complete